MSSVPTDDVVQPPSELQTVELHGHGQTDEDYDGPSQTLMYGGELFEDLSPLADQGRLDVRFNSSVYRPSYLSINERATRQKVPMDESVPEEVDGIHEDDMVLRKTSVGFEIEVHFSDLLGPYDLGGGMRPQCLGFTLIGVHEEWSSNNCQIANHSIMDDSTGYKLSLQVDEFNRGNRE